MLETPWPQTPLKPTEIKPKCSMELRLGLDRGSVSEARPGNKALCGIQMPPRSPLLQEECLLLGQGC
ncbi:hypothetical protein D4764_0274370 [Takifugu flavidus]|uniref:Uncharacterized protein n=1 Tax=Takifugu flavidus TaxID=433684 RepID=A0A5C6MGC8_9TELE|nr:hypothetical protein D4764_0274370 [Takifugu flavidus]